MGSAALLYGLNNEEFRRNINLNILNREYAECGKFMDKHLENAVIKLEKGLKELEIKYPGI